MAGTVDWLYFRPSCISCKRARAYLEANGWTITKETSAAKEKKGSDEALKLARSADKLLVGRGQSYVTFAMKAGDRPSDEELLQYLLGRSGNLRAPTLWLGKTLLVGYSEALYESALGDTESQ
jgi:arsenate reductase-like glutaredoxin family protein